MTLQLELPSDLEHRLHSEAKRRGVDDSEYALNAITESLTIRPAMLSVSEEELLRKIDRGFSADWWKRHAALVQKREDETITEPEHRELTILTSALEEYNVRRMSCLANAAKRHGVGLNELMAQLDIKPRSLD